MALATKDSKLPSNLLEVLKDIPFPSFGEGIFLGGDSLLKNSAAIFPFSNSIKPILDDNEGRITSDIIARYMTAKLNYEDLYPVSIERDDNARAMLSKLKEDLSLHAFQATHRGTFSVPFPTLWATYYKTKTHAANTTLYASSYEAAEGLCRLRGLGETVVGNSHTDPPTLASVHLKRRHWERAAHALVWLSLIASAARIVDPLELLMDDGFIHEMAHIVETARYGQVYLPEIEPLLKRIEDLERRTPGMWPVSSSDQPDIRDREMNTFFGGTQNMGFPKPDRIDYALGRTLVG